MAHAVKKSKKKRGLRGMGGGSGAGAAGSSMRPKFVPKMPPCVGTCPNQNAIREMLMAISKAEALDKPYEQAFEEAFYIFMETTPFLSVCGRVCPHPCEGECNRKEKEGAVGINSIERFIGDFGLEKGLKPRKLTDEVRP